MTPLQQFRAALYQGDVDRVHVLLDEHAEVRDAVNAPIGDFDSRPVDPAMLPTGRDDVDRVLREHTRPA